jgi:hypothetical protein
MVDAVTTVAACSFSRREASMSSAPIRSLRASILAPLVAFAACHTPLPNDLVLLEAPGAARFALSTEDGIVALAGDDIVAQVPCVQYWKGREIRDTLSMIQATPDLALLKPETARFTRSPFADDEVRPEETLYIQLLADDFERLPYVLEAHWHEDGRYGDLLEIDTWFVDEEDVVARFAGAGVYVKRMGNYEIVGLLNGTLASNPAPSGFFAPEILVPFVRLDQIATVLPNTSNYFERRPRPFRADFEHGLERDGTETERANTPPTGNEKK